MAHWRTRTGLPSLKRYLRLVCLLIVKFRPYWLTILSPTDIALIDQLMEICEDVTNTVPTYEPE